MSEHITIYTDGSCLGNPGPGGWAAVLKCAVGEKRIRGGAEMTTNNRMELLAVINALSMLKGPSEVTVYSDSQYIIGAFNNGWLKSWKRNKWCKSSGEAVANKDLWQTLDLVSRKHTIQWVWVKGHADNPYNNLCDKMAVETANKYAKGEMPNLPPTDDTPDIEDDEQEMEQLELSDMTAEMAWGEDDVPATQLPGMEQEQPATLTEDKKDWYQAQAVDILDALLQKMAEEETGLRFPCGGHDWCEFCATQAPTDGMCVCAMAYIDFLRQKEVSGNGTE